MINQINRDIRIIITIIIFNNSNNNKSINISNSNFRRRIRSMIPTTKNIPSSSNRGKQMEIMLRDNNKRIFTRIQAVIKRDIIITITIIQGIMNNNNKIIIIVRNNNSSSSSRIFMIKYSSIRSTTARKANRRLRTSILFLQTIFPLSQSSSSKYLRKIKIIIMRQ